MSSTLLAFASRPARSGGRGRTVPLTAMAEREVGLVVEVRAASEGRDRVVSTTGWNTVSHFGQTIGSLLRS